MNVLIAGMGIAGPTLPWWLDGFDVTVVEKSAALRASGCMIDFWDAGVDVPAAARVVTPMMLVWLALPQGPVQISPLLPVR